MPMTHDLVLDGNVIRSADEAVDEIAFGMPANKGVWLPRHEDKPGFDPACERLEGPQVIVEEDRVVYAWTIVSRCEEIRAQKAAENAAHLQAVLEVGFPWTFGGVNETLQVHRDTDKVNWMRVERGCEKAKSLNLGHVSLTAIGMRPIRCTSNANYDVTVDEALEILSALEQWVVAQMGKKWDIEDDVIKVSETPHLIDIGAEWEAP